MEQTIATDHSPRTGRGNGGEGNTQPAAKTVRTARTGTRRKGNGFGERGREGVHFPGLTISSNLKHSA